MKTIGEIIGAETVTLAEPRVEMRLPSGDTRSRKTTPEEERVSLLDLENMYVGNPVIFNAVNRITQVIMSSGYRFTGSDESVNFIESFLDDIGNRGGNTDWDLLLESVFRHQTVYGRAFNEIIYNVEGDDVLDLDIIDPKKMDYAKDSNNKIVFDDMFNPVGFVEKLSFSESVSFKSDDVPKGVSVGSNEIYFDKSRIAQYKLYTIGDGLYGLGIVEPVIKASRRKLELEKALANIYLKTAFPTKYAKVGDPMHPATEDMLQEVLTQLQETGYDSVHSFPYYVELGLLEPKSPEKLQQNLNYFKEDEVTGSGMPKAFVLGSGESTNRATLGRQEYLFKIGLYDIIDRTTRTIENQVFSRIARLNGLPDVPRFEWNEIALEELDSKADRLFKLARVGLLTPDEAVENIIRKSEGFPLVNETVGDKNAKSKRKSEPKPK